jgi:hypothetical protein
MALGGSSAILASKATALPSLRLASASAREGVLLSRGAENINAGINLNSKLSILESFPKNAVKTRILPDGRIRYYHRESLSITPGLGRNEWLD